MDGETIPFEGENRSSMSNLLEEGKYSDVTITCGEDTYAVHKAIICPRSSFFAACCDGNFKEANSGVINLGDDDPVAVKMMIRYLYTGAYAPPPRRNTVIVDTIDHGTHFEQWELYKKEYDAPEKERMVTQGYVFWGNRVRKRVLDTRPTPETSANPSAPSPPVASQSSAQNQQFRNGNPRGHGPYRLQPGGRHSGSQRGNHTPNSSRPPAPANPAPAAGASTPAPAQPLSEREPNFKLHAQIYALGEKYDIHDLKALALQKFAYEATVFANSVSFFNGIKEAYTSTVDEDRGMRDVVVSTALKNRYLIDDGRFQNLLKTTGLGFDLLLKLM